MPLVWALAHSKHGAVLWGLAMVGSPASRAGSGAWAFSEWPSAIPSSVMRPGPGWKEAGLQSGAAVMLPGRPPTWVLNRTARVVSDNTDSGFHLGPLESWFLPGDGAWESVFWSNRGQCEKECWSGPAVTKALCSRKWTTRVLEARKEFCVHVHLLLCVLYPCFLKYGAALSFPAQSEEGNERLSRQRKSAPKHKGR